MRRWLPQFTIRRLMVGIGLLALLLGGALEIRRLQHQARRYRERANWHDAMAELPRAHVVNMGDPARVVAVTRRAIELRARGVAVPEPGDRVADEEHLAAITAPIIRLREAVVAAQEYHERQRDRYRGAAARPWLALPPEPARVELDVERLIRDGEREGEAANVEFARAMEARGARRPAP